MTSTPNKRITETIKEKIQQASREFRFGSIGLETSEEVHEFDSSKTCPSCGMPLTSQTNHNETVTHDPHTCQLVNLVLTEMRASIQKPIRVQIYTSPGPVRGFYSTADPFAIHISQEAYAQYREYIIFHETKHLVDCLTKGWSEEGTPDTFARNLCIKYGYNSPPQPNVVVLSAPPTQWNVWY